MIITVHYDAIISMSVAPRRCDEASLTSPKVSAGLDAGLAVSSDSTQLSADMASSSSSSAIRADWSPAAGELGPGGASEPAERAPSDGGWPADTGRPAAAAAAAAAAACMKASAVGGKNGESAAAAAPESGNGKYVDGRRSTGDETLGRSTAL